MDITDIKACTQKLKFTFHAKQEMIYEEFGVIKENEIKEAIRSGEIIEEYSGEGRPYPAFLVYGLTKRQRPLHIVCAPVVEEKLLVVITVYQPDPERWINYRRRKI